MWEGYYLCLAVRESKGPAGTLTHIFWFEFLVNASNGSLLQLVNNRADHLFILQPQLLVDDLHVPHWVHRPLDMDDILVLKSTCGDRTQHVDTCTCNIMSDTDFSRSIVQLLDLVQ